MHILKIHLIVHSEDGVIWLSQNQDQMARAVAAIFDCRLDLFDGGSNIGEVGGHASQEPPPTRSTIHSDISPKQESPQLLAGIPSQNLLSPPAEARTEGLCSFGS
jgi:hypothetical protein